MSYATDLFLQAYLQCALWSSSDDNDEPLDNNFSAMDLSEETYRKMEEDCNKFVLENWNDIYMDLEKAGHDFWLTRNGHGAGFWDGDWEKETGERLTKASEAFGEFDLYVGDDGKVWGTP